VSVICSRNQRFIAEDLAPLPWSGAYDHTPLLLSHSPAVYWVLAYFAGSLSHSGGGSKQAQSSPDPLECREAIFPSYHLGSMLYSKTHCGGIICF